MDQYLEDIQIGIFEAKKKRPLLKTIAKDIADEIKNDENLRSDWSGVCSEMMTSYDLSEREKDDLYNMVKNLLED